MCGNHSIIQKINDKEVYYNEHVLLMKFNKKLNSQLRRNTEILQISLEELQKYLIDIHAKITKL